jgi:hypothetical protein
MPRQRAKKPAAVANGRPVGVILPIGRQDLLDLTSAVFVTGSGLSINDVAQKMVKIDNKVITNK